MSETDLTPLMRQYQDIKHQHPEAILFFRVGDFYEMFFKDAEEASQILQIVLTSRSKSKGTSIPLCGVPHHAANGYISKLLKAGRTVALCEQVEDPKLAKGLVRREIVRLYTPGTLFDADLLPQKESNFLAALSCSVHTSGSTEKKTVEFGLSTLDLSTGEFWVTESTSHLCLTDLLDELNRIEPKELIHSQKLPTELLDSLNSLTIPRLTSQDPSWFQEDHAAKILLNHFQVDSLEELEMTQVTKGVQAAGALLEYLKSTQPIANHHHIRRPRFQSLEETMQLDSVTIRNLEIIKPLFEDRRSPTLLSILDKTVTSPGGRLFRQWMTRPLLRLPIIQARLRSVSEFVNHYLIRSNLRTSLESIQDLERLNSRVSLGVANPRELVALKQSLEVFPAVRQTLESMNSSIIVDCLSHWDDLQDICQLIDETIVPNPPLASREGGIIKDGYHVELDELRKITKEGTRWIAELEARERSRTGIESLKIKFNQIFGYYIEITKANLGKVPQDYHRKQTLVNAERFMTEELRQLEDRMTGATQKVKNLELSLFTEVLIRVSQATTRIQIMSGHIALLDVLASLAESASENRYVCPQVDESGTIRISDGRHPIIERMSPTGGFIPNSTNLNLESDRLLLITGPNMAGKSTYLRQVALIVLMAQIGSFVPAQSAQIGLVDRIFTRVGASDDIASGQSTFMVEMVETARILDQATRRSLILLDEVGRGTSTYDGLSIAWALAEYLLDRCHVGSRTLFATHYHEMNQLEAQREGVKNYTVLVKEKDQHILFLRKIIEGKADRSYGIHVAKLAGLPSEVIDRAQNILSQLEGLETKTEISEEIIPSHDGESEKKEAFPQPHFIVEEVKQMDLFGMTPLEALNRLADIKRRLETEG